MTKNLSRWILAAFASLVISAPAFALGGLDQAKSVAEDIKTGLYALLGVVAVLYMIYLAFMAFTEKKTWADFGWGVVHVCCAGAVVALATWAWSAFQ